MSWILNMGVLLFHRKGYHRLLDRRDHFLGFGQDCLAHVRDDEHIFAFNLQRIFLLAPTHGNNLNGFYNRFRGKIQDSTFDKGVPSFMINSQNMFTFKKGWTAEMSVFYMSPQVYGIFFMKSMSNVTIGVQKTLLKEKGNLKLSVSDIFWTSRWRSSVQFQNMDIAMKASNTSRMLNVSFTYKFGNSKAQYQKKESGASDELDRIKKG